MTELCVHNNNGNNYYVIIIIIRRRLWVMNLIFGSETENAFAFAATENEIKNTSFRRTSWLSSHSTQCENIPFETNRIRSTTTNSKYVLDENSIYVKRRTEPKQLCQTSASNSTKKKSDLNASLSFSLINTHNMCVVRSKSLNSALKICLHSVGKVLDGRAAPTVCL